MSNNKYKVLLVEDDKNIASFIQTVLEDLGRITPQRFCKNDLVNLLCSSFAARAERDGAQLTIDAQLPQTLSLPEPELCSLLSNALENALNAVENLPPSRKWIKFYCTVKQNKLLIEIRNPYTGVIELSDGLPVAAQDGHGYGCRSIRSIVERHRGLCSFEPDGNIFKLRIVLPIKN